MIDQFRQSQLDMDAKLKDRCDWAMNSRTSRHIEGDEFLLHDAVTSNGFTLSNKVKLRSRLTSMTIFKNYTLRRLLCAVISGVMDLPVT